MLLLRWLGDSWTADSTGDGVEMRGDGAHVETDGAGAEMDHSWYWN